MNAVIHGSPSFAYIAMELAPGESIIAESDAMTSMDADLDMQAELNGGFVKGLARKFLGGESLFVNRFTNNTSGSRRLTLVQKTPGDIRRIDLAGGSFCLQPGAFVAASPELNVGLRWAGLSSLIAREGLFKLEVSGTGALFYGAYGAMIDRMIDGEFIVDSGHLVAYEPQMKIRLQLAGGIFSSLLGGEGLVARIEGKGRIVMQTRSLGGLVGWLNPKI